MGFPSPVLRSPCDGEGSFPWHLSTVLSNVAPAKFKGSAKAHPQSCAPHALTNRGKCRHHQGALPPFVHYGHLPDLEFSGGKLPLAIGGRQCFNPNDPENTYVIKTKN
jgi:hypothetical protein